MKTEDEQAAAYQTLTEHTRVEINMLSGQFTELAIILSRAARLTEHINQQVQSMRERLQLS